MMMELFVKGGPMMWPLLATSIIALTVVIERELQLARGRPAAWAEPAQLVQR